MRCTIPLLVAAAVRAQAPEIRYLAGNHAAACWPQLEIDGERFVGCRAVDAFTGAGIAGAELFLVEEADTPVAGRFEFVRKVATDADGFAALPAGKHGGAWLILRAPGYGPASSSHIAAGAVWPLQRGLDVPVQVRDWLDRPVAGAGVGLCLGCGHTPDVANAVTGADGVAVLKGVDPRNDIADVYPQHPDLGFEHYDGVHWTPGDPPGLVHATFAAPVRGTLLGVDGKPVARAFVGIKQVHRGPWTRTRDDGSFQLDGADAEADLIVVLADRPGHEYGFERPWEQPCTLRLPPANDEPSQFVALPPATGEQGALRLRIDGAEGRAAVGLDLCCVGPLPLRHGNHATTDSDGSAGFELVAGRYEVQCRDDGSEELVGSVEVAAATTTARTLRLTPLPTVRIEAPAGCRVTLLRRGKRVDVTGRVASGEPVPIPSSGSFGLGLDSADDERTFAFTSEAARQQQPLRLRFLPPTRITAQCVDAGGRPVPVCAALLTRAEWLGSDPFFDLLRFQGRDAADGRVAVQSRGRGLHLLALRPRDAGSTLRPLLLPLSLPPRGEDARVELGAVRLPSAPRLRLVDAAGAAYRGPAPGWLRLGWQNVRLPPAPLPLDADGGSLGLEPQAGDAIVVPAAAFDLEADAGSELPAVAVPHRTVLQGDGPWTIAVPAGELLLTAADAAGQPLDAHAFVADCCVEFRGRVLLRQLPPGPLRLWVAAEGTKTACATVAVPARGRGELRLLLPPR